MTKDEIERLRKGDRVLWNSWPKEIGTVVSDKIYHAANNTPSIFIEWEDGETTRVNHEFWKKLKLIK